MEKENQQPLNIYQKLAKIRKPIEYITKNKAGYGYRYVSEDEILAKIKGNMEKYGVSLIPQFVPNTTVLQPYTYEKVKRDKAGNERKEINNEFIVQSEMQWHWVNDENPEEKIIVNWPMIGQQTDASQAFGAGLTYASRYFMLKYFNCATSDDDPDEWKRKRHEAETEEERVLAKAIVNKVNSVVADFLSKDPENKNKSREKVAAIVKKHVRDDKNKPSANYNLIETQDVARELLEDLTKNLVSPEQGKKEDKPKAN